MSTAATSPRLTRRRDCWVAGVAGGLADHLGWPPALVRTAFVVTAFLGGAGILFYAWLWALAPWSDGRSRVTRRAPVAWILVAAEGVLLVAVVATAVGRADASALGALVPLAFGAVALAAAAGCWATFVDRADPDRGPRAEQAVRAAASGGLVVIALVSAAAPGAGVGGFLLAVVCLLGVALVFAPALLTVWRDLVDERVGRIRDEQRSEMAAHLHDSVLQTLALIQNRAGASSEAGRLARAQERELRSWLYDADAPADSDLATDLRDFAAALELDYPVRIEVVAVGMSSERASGELAAAAREAMLNAARHAGGEVSVYLEGSDRGVDVYVRDRGPGFDPLGVPADRLGVRESIVGRMRRAGGSATVRPGVGGQGTEVHLAFLLRDARRTVPPEATSPGGRGAPPDATSPGGRGAPPDATSPGGRGAPPDATSPGGRGAPPDATSPGGRGGPPDAPSLGGRGAPPEATFLGGRGAPPEATSLGGRGAPPEATSLGGRGAPPDAASPGGRGAPPEATRLETMTHEDPE
ncbi:PspC domain-containing protein [Agromyces sp. MMS24-JH15]|uniref:PspC domain-containing protein n=1 Tax=Agromyces sp. MMS24-JH15 TaxID=3243765 RepID=UPI00374A583D